MKIKNILVLRIITKNVRDEKKTNKSKSDVEDKGRKVEEKDEERKE